MESQDQENNEFVSADVFLQRLSGQAPPPPQPSNAAHKRASLAQLGSIRNKITMFESSGPIQPLRAAEQGQRRGPAGGMKLAPVAEAEEHGSKPGSGKPGAAPRSSFLSRVGLAAIEAVLPSPATKQSMAKQQEAVGFPSIIFGTKPQPKQPGRGPLPKPRSSTDSEQWSLAAGHVGGEQGAPADEQTEGAAENASEESSLEWHDAAETQVVLKDESSGSVSSEATTVVPSSADDMEVDSTAESGLPAPEACESPHLSLTNQHVSSRHPISILAASEVFHSAVDMLPLDGSLALAASGSFSLAAQAALRASRPSNLGPGEGTPAPADTPAAADEADAVGAAPSPAAAPAGAAAEEECGESQGELPVGAAIALGAAEQLVKAAAEEESGESQGEVPAGSPAEQPSAAAAPVVEEQSGESLGEVPAGADPAASSPQPPLATPVVEEQSSESLAEVPAAAANAAGSHEQPMPAAAGEDFGEASASAAALATTSEQPPADGTGVTATASASPEQQDGAGAAEVLPGTVAQVQAEGPAAALPSLRREFSEADLLYQGLIASPEAVDAVAQAAQAGAPGSPAAAAATAGAAAGTAGASPEAAPTPAVYGTPQRAASLPVGGDAATPDRQLVAALPASPTAPANTPATPLLRAQQQAAAAAATAQAAPPHSAPVEASAVADAITGLAGPGLAATPVQSSLGAAGGRSPYSATKYDGDDVVMEDAVLTPAPARSAAKPATRNKLEALVLAGLAVARAPLPLSPCKTPSKPVGLEAAERHLFAAEAVQIDSGDSTSVGQASTAEPAAAAVAAAAEAAARVEGDSGSDSAASAKADAVLVAEEGDGPAGEQSARKEAAVGVAAAAEQQQGEGEGVVSADAAPAEEPGNTETPGAEQLAALPEVASPSFGRARLFSESVEMEVAEVEAGLEPAPAAEPADGSAASMKAAGEPQHGSPQLGSAVQPAAPAVAGEALAATASEAAAAAPELPAVLQPLGSPVVQQQSEVAAAEELRGSPAPEEQGAPDAALAAGSGSPLAAAAAADGQDDPLAEAAGAEPEVPAATEEGVQPPSAAEPLASEEAGEAGAMPATPVAAPAASAAAVAAAAALEAAASAAKPVVPLEQEQEVASPQPRGSTAKKSKKKKKRNKAAAASPVPISLLAEEQEHGPAAAGPILEQKAPASPAVMVVSAPEQHAADSKDPAAAALPAEQEGSDTAAAAPVAGEQDAAAAAVATPAEMGPVVAAGDAGETEPGEVEVLEVNDGAPSSPAATAAAEEPGSPAAAEAALGEPGSPATEALPVAAEEEGSDAAPIAVGELPASALADNTPAVGPSTSERATSEMGGALCSNAAPEASATSTAAPALLAAEPLAGAAEEEAALGEGSAESAQPDQPAPLEECPAAAAQGDEVEQERPTTPGSPISGAGPEAQLAPPQAGDAGREDPEALPCPPSPAESCGSVGCRPADAAAAAAEDPCGSPSARMPAVEEEPADPATTIITPRPGSPLADTAEQPGEQDPPQQPQQQQRRQPTPSSAAAAAAGPRPASPAAMQVVGPPAAVARPVVSRLSLGAAARDSPAMSFNPLSAALTPQHSVRSSGSVPAAAASTGGVGGAYSSCNPLFAGTPGNPTPQSTVTMRTFASRLADGTPMSKEGAGATPASVGIKLAERLQEVASQLAMQPAPSSEPGSLMNTPRQQLGGTAGQPVLTPRKFEFAADVAAMLQALDQRTPATSMLTPRRAAALATTIQKHPRAARFSLGSHGVPLLDLAGFDADGNRNSGAAATPAGAQHQGRQLPPMPEGSTEGEDGPAAAPSAAEVAALLEEVASLRSKVADLESQREEAVGMLAGYQGSIAQLQDQHSVIMVKVQTENTMLKAEVEQFKASRADMERQFHSLYYDKYVPMKAELLPLRQDSGALRAQLAAEEAKASKAELAVVTLRQELSAAKAELVAMKDERAAALAAASAAQQAEQQALAAEQRALKELKAEQKRSSQVLAAAEAEAADARAQCAMLARQADELQHRLSLAKQAKERAANDMARKEEEICALEVKLRELEGVLREYKKENSKFFEMKERYKVTIAALERQVQAKEEEKATLLKMCDELMNQLEREGLALDGPGA